MKFNQSFYGGKNCSVFGSGSGGVFPVSVRDAENSNGMRDLTAPGKRDSPKFGQECDIRHSDDRTSG